MLTEATLDFPTKRLDFLRAADASNRLAAIRDQLQGVLARARQGALLRDGLSVVLIGEPNVGKSSLQNQLAGGDVAIVTPIAGTTRDAIASAIEIAGIPLTIVDTAGLRATDDPIETIGIERTWAAIARADLALVIVDARVTATQLPEGSAAILAALPAGLPRIVVHNKIDLVADASPGAVQGERAIRDELGARSHVYLSAKTGAGIDALRDEIRQLAGAQEDMEGTFLARERHWSRCATPRRTSSPRARILPGQRPPLELFAEELREAQVALSTITGEFTADDLLGVIFSRFCIGK
jgi:tRNA modification GTPase